MGGGRQGVPEARWERSQGAGPSAPRAADGECGTGLPGRTWAPRKWPDGAPLRRLPCEEVPGRQVNARQGWTAGKGAAGSKVPLGLVRGSSGYHPRTSRPDALRPPGAGGGPRERREGAAEEAVADLTPLLWVCHFRVAGSGRGDPSGPGWGGDASHKPRSAVFRRTWTCYPARRGMSQGAPQLEGPPPGSRERVRGCGPAWVHLYTCAPVLVCLRQGRCGNNGISHLPPTRPAFPQAVTSSWRQNLTLTWALGLGCRAGSFLASEHWS